MKIVIIGISHKTAPVALRERLSFTPEQLPEAVGEMVSLDAVREGVILSTCNRVEIYGVTRDPDSGIAQISAWLAANRKVPLAELDAHLYSREEEEAIRHGFRVASSLDSMVVGEPQILGQMKQAYQQAVEANATGLVLNKYFHRIFQVAKRVRNETAIAENPVSIAYAAVELARRIFGKLDEHTCLLIGAGEMCELAARHLVQNGIKRVLVTNRTFARAVTLAQEFDGHAFPLEELAHNLDQADIIISSTGSTSYLVTATMVAAALKRRRQRPMFFIDIAVPRDLDPRIGEVESAFLYDIDDLNRIVEKNRKERDQAAQQAEQIVAEEVPAFTLWLNSLNVVPTIVALRQQMEELRDQEIARTVAHWPGLETEEKERLERFGRLLVNKILHSPISRLRTLSSMNNGELYVDAIRTLFELK